MWLETMASDSLLGINRKAAECFLPWCHSILQDLGWLHSGPHDSRWYYRGHPYCRGLPCSLGDTVVRRNKVWATLT